MDSVVEQQIGLRKHEQLRSRNAKLRPSVLVVDTQTEGHHLSWLAMSARSLRESGYRVVLLTNPNVDRVRSELSLFLCQLDDLVLIPTRYGKVPSQGDYFSEILQVKEQNNCDEVLLNNIDTIASNMFRLAALGFYPPQGLRGKLSGIYIRPRPLDPRLNSLELLWKRAGLRRLLKRKYFKRLFVLDSRLSGNGGDDVKCFLPDPWIPSGESQSIPEVKWGDGCVRILQYGVGDRRKGSRLLLEALSALPSASRIHLVLAGRQKDPSLAKLLRSPNIVKRVTLLNRYITQSEERWLFENSSWVALPYLSHYGSSANLSKAAYYQVPVIASDYDYLGYQVSTHHLGICFRNGKVRDLRNALVQAENLNPADFKESMSKYAMTCSFVSFKQSLLDGLSRERS